MKLRSLRQRCVKKKTKKQQVWIKRLAEVTSMKCAIIGRNALFRSRTDTSFCFSSSFNLIDYPNPHGPNRNASQFCSTQAAHVLENSNNLPLLFEHYQAEWTSEIISFYCIHFFFLWSAWMTKSTGQEFGCAFAHSPTTECSFSLSEMGILILGLQRAFYVQNWSTSITLLRFLNPPHTLKFSFRAVQLMCIEHPQLQLHQFFKASTNSDTYVKLGHKHAGVDGVFLTSFYFAH